MLTKQAITRALVKDVVKWQMQHHRKPITPRSLRPIMLKHVIGETGIIELEEYWVSKEGKRVWQKAMRDEFKAQR